MKNIILTSILVAGSIASASRLEVVGEGVVVQPAEFLRLDMAIISSCHPSARESRGEVDATASELQSLLQKHANSDIGDQIQVSQGNNEQSVKTRYEKNADGDNVTVIVCDQDHSWESSSTVSFKLTKLSDLAQVQDEILVFMKQKNHSIDINSPGLVMTLSEPQPGVLANTWDAMKASALKTAHSQALGEARVIADLQQPGAAIELIKMTDARNTSGAPIYDRVTGQTDSNGNSFGRVVLRLSRLFIFNVK
ncbi:MAG: hypothetical protein K0R29_409 [Pseudobdellovibrio sp.]|jgi:hypothetical protein|nr:hypothetical protein [Pseudobdellovibrio sp.]